MIDELYKEGRDYEYFIRMREAEMQNEAYRQSEQEAKEIIAELKQENNALRRTIKDVNIVAVVERSKQYRSALEEINTILNEAYRTGRRTLALAKIRDMINEVLE